MHRASLKNRFSKCDQENLRKRIKHLKECAPKICFMDASYKTTRYALPLFFQCVKTNIDY